MKRGSLSVDLLVLSVTRTYIYSLMGRLLGSTDYKDIYMIILNLYIYSEFLLYCDTCSEAYFMVMGIVLQDFSITEISLVQYQLVCVYIVC